MTYIILYVIITTKGCDNVVELKELALKELANNSNNDTFELVRLMGKLVSREDGVLKEVEY